METASRFNRPSASSHAESPTIPQLVRRHINMAYDDTTLTPKKLTVLIMRDYTAHVSEDDGRLPIRDFQASEDDFETLLDRRKAFVKQLVDPESTRHVPAEILPTLCRVLPAPYGDSLRYSIVRQLGCMGVDQIDALTPSEDVSGISKVLERVAKVAERYAPLIDDGVLDHRDAKNAPAAMDACDEAAAALVGLRARIAERTKTEEAA